jgi:hypothetical protein
VSAKQIESPQMDRKSIVPGLVGALVAIGLATALALEHQSKLDRREEQQALQKQLNRVTELSAANERQANLPVTVNRAQPLVSDPAGELLRLRTELSALRRLTNELEGAQKENTEAHAALDRYLTNAATVKVATADFWPRDSWKFAGFATPDDALKSSFWASYNGDVKALLDSTTGEFRQMIEKDNEGKSADEASIRAMDEVSNLKSIQVINRDFQSEDTAVLTAAFEDGDQTHTTKLILKKVGNEWKIAGMGE